MAEFRGIWHSIGYPIEPGDHLPAERKTVLVWLGNAEGERGCALPFCGYIRYAAGERESPYFVVYHGNTDIGANVVAWCDCLPDNGPDLPTASMYSHQQHTGRGYPERRPENNPSQS